MTRPTTLSSQPAASSLAIMRGSTVSDEVVAITISSSFADVADQAHEAEAAPMADRPQHDDDEDEAGQVEADQELAEREQRAGAELADGKRHGAEGADRRGAHHDGDDAKKHPRGDLDQVGERLAGRAQGAEGEAAQHRDVEHLEHVAVAERADEGVGDDVEKKLRGG